VTVRLVYFDSQVLGVQAENLRHQLDNPTGRRDGPSSPRWIACKACGAHRGDQCHVGDDYCATRVEANRDRLMELQTWAARWVPACHPDHPVVPWLCWRTADDELAWSGVPCFAPGCGRTYEVQQRASDLVDDRMPVNRINPHMVEMTCWSTEQSDPWREVAP